MELAAVLNSLLDSFRINKVDPDRPYLYIRIQVFKDRKSLAIDLNEKNAIAHFKDVINFQSNHNGLVWIMSVSPPNLDIYAMHESVHAAFSLSRRLKWKYGDENEREEFIAINAEYIYKQI